NKMIEKRKPRRGDVQGLIDVVLKYQRTLTKDEWFKQLGFKTSKVSVENGPYYMDDAGMIGQDKVHKTLFASTIQERDVTKETSDNLKDAVLGEGVKAFHVTWE